MSMIDEPETSVGIRVGDLPNADQLPEVDLPELQEQPAQPLQITIRPSGQTFADADDPYDLIADSEEAQELKQFTNIGAQAFSRTDTHVDPETGDEVTYGVVSLESGREVRVPAATKSSQQRFIESPMSTAIGAATEAVGGDIAKAIPTGIAKGAAATAEGLIDIITGPNASLVPDPLKLMYEGVVSIQESLIGDPSQIEGGIRELFETVAPDLTNWLAEPYNNQTLGNLLQSLSQFATPAVAAAAGIKAISSANAFVRSLGWGAIADYFAFDPMTPTATQSLIEAFDTEDPEQRLAVSKAAINILGKEQGQNILNRMKMWPEGALIGVTFEAVLQGIMRSPQGARATAELTQAAAEIVRRKMADIGMAAEGRMAERAVTRSTTLNMGVDPTDIVDPVLAAAGRVARGKQVDEVRTDTRQGSEIVADRLKVLVPENRRVAGGKKYRAGQPDGRAWSELSEQELNAPGPGFQGSEADIERMLQEAIEESSVAAKEAASDTGMNVTLTAQDWNAALELPLRSQLWYELSGEAFAQRIPYLQKNSDEFITFTDLVGVTSPREKPLGNLQRALALLSQKVRGVPIDIDLTNPTGVQEALARQGSGTALASGNKTGNFSDTLSMVGGADVAAPIPVNDVWVGRIFGVTEDQLMKYQSLHEPMAIFWNKLRDFVNDTAPGQFPHESWQLQARGWVSTRGAQSDYAQAMDIIANQLRAAGVPGVTPEGVITEQALRHPDFVTTLRPTVQPYRDAPKATIEFGTTQTQTGARAAVLSAKLRELPDDPKAQRLYQDMNKILTSEMYKSARGARNMWDQTYAAVMNLPAGTDVSRIRMGTQARPFDVAGSFEGVFSPNIRVPLRGMNDDQVALFHAIVGKGLRQDAMASSRIRIIAADAEPDAGTVRGQTVFIKTADDLDGDEIEAFSRALPEGFDVSTERVPNGYIIDINPRFGDEGPVGIADAEINPALRLLKDRNLEVGTMYHQHSSVYNEASEYTGRIAAQKKELRDGAVNELVERVGLTRREARGFLAGKVSGPGTKAKQQRAGRIRTALTGRLSDLDASIAAARQASEGVDKKLKDWVSTAEDHLAAPTAEGRPPDIDAPTVVSETTPPPSGVF